MSRRGFAATMVALVALAVLMSAGEASARSQRLSAAEGRVVSLINMVRAEHGRAPLKISYALSRAAERHSRSMLRHGYFAHSSLSGRSPGTRIRLSGYRAVGARAWRVGEVIGWGAGGYGRPEVMVAMWMKSSTHRAILLSRRWQHVGVGRVVGSFQGCGGAAVCTVDFGCLR